jgi:hypothetical protein
VRPISAIIRGSWAAARLLRNKEEKRMLNLTTEEYRILIKPTRIEQWGAQQKVARRVKETVKAQQRERVYIDDRDIAALNRAILVLETGGYVPSGNELSGGWEHLKKWAVSSQRLLNQFLTSGEMLP